MSIMPTTRHPSIPSSDRRRPSAAQRAFSLIEILVVVALLSVIIIGLVAMFDQTRRALVSSTTQVDVLESGRAASELIGRELEQITPGYSRDVNGHNFNVALEFYPDGTPAVLTQKLADPVEVRTNMMQQLFFVTHNNLQWNAVGYVITTPEFGVGTLYRTNYTLTSPAQIGLALTNFMGLPLPPGTINLPMSSSRIVEGVVHFSVRAYAYGTNVTLITNSIASGMIAAQAIVIPAYNIATDNYNYQLKSNATPAYVELEMGFLETRALERLKSITDSPASRKFLATHAGQVHLFRQRIPIRNVDPAAYK
ncbi:MAG: hypothetical protein JWR19_3312 [Pedosphaera sp.]|nr:hypothetical protein [Pedosphaera sp.]